MDRGGFFKLATAFLIISFAISAPTDTNSGTDLSKDPLFEDPFYAANQLDLQSEVGLSDNDCGFQNSILTDEHDLTKRVTPPGVCPSPYQMKKDGSSGSTRTRIRPPSTNKKESTTDDGYNPCPHPKYPNYVSCGGPEIPSGDLRILMAVMNCKRDYHTSIEARGMFLETHTVNRYCCHEVTEHWPEFAAGVCMYREKFYDLRQVTVEEFKQEVLDFIRRP